MFSLGQVYQGTIDDWLNIKVDKSSSNYWNVIKVDKLNNIITLSPKRSKKEEGVINNGPKKGNLQI